MLNKREDAELPSKTHNVSTEKYTISFLQEILKVSNLKAKDKLPQFLLPVFGSARIICQSKTIIGLNIKTVTIYKYIIDDI